VGVLGLDEFLIAQVFALLFVFARVGTALVILPVFGENFVSQRVRLLLALALSLLLVPVLQERIPPAPSSAPVLLRLLAIEVVAGVFIGTVARIFLATLDTAGMFISLQTGLASAAIFNPALGVTGSPFGSFLGMAGLALIAVTDLHHMLLLGLAASYDLFVPGVGLPMGDFAQTVGRALTQSFAIGFQMAAPFIIGGILLNTALGVLSRLVPQMQIFFVALPLQIGAGILLMMASAGAAMLLWLNALQSAFTGLFLAPG
jgi:flagellar biosynthetic protein FliR